MRPILHDLEYDDGLRSWELLGVDATAHYAAVLTAADDADLEAYLNEELLEALSIAFDRDPLLVDDAGRQRPWRAYGADLGDDLRISLGEPRDDDSCATVADLRPLVDRWLAAYRSSGIATDARRRRADAVESCVKAMRGRFSLDADPAMASVALAAMLSAPGGFAALPSAVEAAGASDPTAALRALSAIAPPASPSP